MSVVIDSKVFHEHLKTLYESWDQGREGALWGPSTDALLVVHGTPKQDDGDPCGLVARNPSSIALLYWLIGYEFTDIAMLFTKDKLCIFTSQKKGLLSQNFFFSSLFHVKYFC